MATDEKNPEEILDVNRRWLPPSPHVEKVIEMVLKGAAIIEKRGHSEPPLLMFEDGGVMELHKVRYEDTYNGMVLVSGDGAVGEGVTKFLDVCGCVDHIKGTLRDHPDAVQSDPHIFDQLLDHAMYMIDRMYKREAAYRQFAADIITACAHIPQGPSPATATSAADEIKSILHDHPEDTVKYTDLLGNLAEDVRYVASNQEKCLKEYKELAMKIHALYAEIKGARNWEDPKVPR